MIVILKGAKYLDPSPPACVLMRMYAALAGRPKCLWPLSDRQVMITAVRP
jgi:hypothetical protein